MTYASPSACQYLRNALVPLAALLASGCGGAQSVLHPHSVEAREVALLGWIMFWGAAAILALVTILVLYALLARPERRWRINERGLVLIGGGAFPLVVLTALLIYAVTVGNIITGQTPSEDTVHIEVVGHQWWWEVRYLDAQGEVQFVTANELHIPVGHPVEIAVKTGDVIHSFWVPALAGKIDMIPGRINHVRFTADEPGTYRGQCAEFCGAQHAAMAFYVLAEEPDAYDAWRAKQMQPAPAPEAPLLARGFKAFMENGCAACHTIRGRGAAGTLGPDLTHVGGRHSLAAGTLTNNADSLARWITDSQQVKPGNTMPSFSHLQGETLRALVAYLESLE